VESKAQAVPPRYPGIGRQRAVAPQRLAAAGEAASAPRWRWDYFVRNLLGAERPQEYEIGKRNPPAP